MTEVVAKNYILTKKQLYILLIGCGGKSIRGLELDAEIPNEREIVSIMGELSEKNCVISDGKNFSTVGDIDKIIKLIMFADNFYIIKSRNNVPSLCCYGDGKQFAVCETMITKSDSIRLSLCNFEGLFAKLLDEGYFGECYGEYFVNNDELEEFESNFLGKRDVLSENNGSSRRIFSMDKITIDGTDRYVDIAEYFLCDYILDVSGENITRKPCSVIEIRKSIKKLLEEGI